MNRRNFITKTAMAGAGAVLSEITDLHYPIPAPSSGRFIHIFSKPLQWLDYEATAEVIAEASAEGIDLTVRPGGHVLPENVRKDLPAAVNAARKRGLKVDMIVTSITGADEKYTGDILQTASELGIKFYRLGYLNYDDKAGVWGTLQKYKPEFKKLEELNRKYNIHGAYQNHYGTRVGGAVWDLYELLKELDPQYIGCQYDVRHAVAEGGNSWVNGLKLIAPWVKCTDLKDFKWSQDTRGRWNPESVPIGTGSVNFDEYFRIVKSFNIGGPVSIHLEYPPFERYNVQMSEAEKRKLFVTEMKKDIEKVKSFFEKY
ncbi:MAG: sugar phosphate isomerase/epimerase family protein, partial [Bacteroidales bacterium]